MLQFAQVYMVTISSKESGKGLITIPTTVMTSYLFLPTILKNVPSIILKNFPDLKVYNFRLT